MNELIKVEPQNVLTVFTTEQGLDPLLEKIKQEVKEFEHDLSTGAGRKRTASLARKVASSKTYLDGLGKDLTSGWKAKAKVVDSERKRMRDFLDALKEDARKPLTDWEQEQERIEAEEAAKLEAERVAAELEQAHEIALLMNEKFDRDAKEAAEKAEAVRIAREEEIKRQAAEDARITAEAKAKEETDRIEREKQEAIQREEEAKQQVIKAEKARVAAEWLTYLNEAYAENARIDASWLAYITEAYEHHSSLLAKEQAERNRIAAEAKAKQDTIDAAAKAEREKAEAIKRERREADERERQRIADEKAVAAKVEAERLEREADIEHRKRINNEALSCLMMEGINESVAKHLIKMIAKGQVSHVAITY